MINDIRMMKEKYVVQSVFINIYFSNQKSVFLVHYSSSIDCFLFDILKILLKSQIDVPCSIFLQSQRGLWEQEWIVRY